MKRIIAVTIFLIFIAAVFFYVYRKNIASNFIPTIKQIGDISITIKNDTAIIGSKLAIENTSFFRIKIDTLKYKLSLFNKTYLQNTRFIGKTLRGYGVDTLYFSLKVPYLTLLKDFKTERKKRDSASYTVNISIKYATAFAKAEFPIQKSARLKIPQPPEIEIVDITYTKIRWKSIKADVKIKIVNNSNVTLTVKNMSYSMNIIEQGHLKGNYREQLNIKPYESTFINIPIKINVDNIGKTVFDILMNRDQYNYTFNLNGILESIDPVKKTFTLDVTKNDVMELKK